MRYLPLLLCLLLTLPASAQNVIETPPETVPEHNIIILKGDEGTSWTWIIRRLPDGFRPKLHLRDKGQECIWTAPPGRYDIDVIALYDGALIQDYTQLIIEGTDTPDPPAPGPDLTGFSKSVEEWSKATNDPQSAQALALAYRQVADAVRDNTLTVPAAITSLGQASNIALENAKGDWSTFRSKVSEELNLRQQRGLISNNTQLHNFLAEVIKGLESSATGSKALTLPAFLRLSDSYNAVIERNK